MLPANATLTVAQLLGYGFYEQKLVADQILATAGQRFLEGFGDNDSQYKQLHAQHNGPTWCR
ncbi:hypothetical protein RAS12_08905 [Achromobacter seleniivolatilans]|uniref:Uncharacterized protein n=1 Tax=Achromobacter seleniivolatilans TaxID=3047478 RepID=A0ABY9M667_9BURK|nr:hypothetical protein [Achromobacter sp. R39]WMD22481.1 hypothetical protein RAS12_08905 [Achromobacter sp. R39]